MERFLPYLAALLFSIIFGFSFMFTKEGLELIRPLHLLSLRFFIAAFLLTLLYILRIVRINLKGKNIAMLLLLAIIQPGLYFLFETLGINRTSSSEAGIMIALIPIVVTILANLFLGEKTRRLQFFFILLSVCGVIFIVVMKGVSEGNINYIGLLYLFAAVLTAAFYNILSRFLSLQFKPVEITFIMMWTGAIFFTLLMILKYNYSLYQIIRPVREWPVFVVVFYLGAFSSVLAYFMMNYTLSRLEAARSAVFANLTTVISILAGVVFRGESFYWYQAFGACLIITGIFGTNYFGKMKKGAEELPI
ncbi:DMT family transporter [Halocella sp. SP3-1]|uniref:DMT family transporter n=1 Tax=Halocella sp. SP3-1 TaxID=2382161 RepID=UPI000F758B4E|nr:DMT family transporter [Halocella sp. SP3-1]